MLTVCIKASPGAQWTTQAGKLRNAAVGKTLPVRATLSENSMAEVAERMIQNFRDQSHDSHPETTDNSKNSGGKGQVAFIWLRSNIHRLFLNEMPHKI
jgi:hypothetical protein